MVDEADGIGQHGGSGQILDLVALDALLGGDGVQEEDLLDDAVLDALDGGAGEDAVGGAGGTLPLAPPISTRALAAPQREPAVSTMSSSRMTRLPFTSPMMFMTSEELAFWRRLSTMAMGMSSFWAKARARATEPTSGETTMVFSSSPSGVLLMKWSTKMGAAQQVVHGDVEEALDLVGVQVHGQHPVGAGGGDQVGHQLGGDGVAGLGLAVLAGIAEVGDHGGDPAGGGPLEGVDHHQQLHQVVVHRGQQVDWITNTSEPRTVS